MNYRFFLLPTIAFHLLFSTQCAYRPTVVIDPLFKSSPISNRWEVNTPDKTLVILYNPGSRAEFWGDRCHHNSVNKAGGPPAIIAELDGKIVQGRTIRVYTLCDATLVGEFNAKKGKGFAKTEKRLTLLEAAISTLRKQNIPAHNIFLVGHSAGGWISLEFLATQPESVNSAIVFAPALSGKKASRTKGWWKHRRKRVKILSQAKEIPALVFSFEHDPFEDPRDLKFLEKIRGITYVPLSNLEINGVDCAEFGAHFIHRAPCIHTQLERIESFLEQRLD